MALVVLGAYVVVGIVFGVPFQAWGARRIDPAAEGAGWGFKLLTFPAVAALWPYLAVRWVRRVPPTEESSPHWRAARGRP